MIQKFENIVYFQPRLSAGRNYRNGEGREQIWCPWWALLLHQHAKSVGLSGEIVDARCDKDWRSKLSSVLSPSSILAVSALTGHALIDAIDASKMAIERGARVVWGGPHATLFPLDVAREPFVNHVISGYGAPMFGQFLAGLQSGCEMPAIMDSRGARGQPATKRNGPIIAVPFRPALELVRDWTKYVNADQAIGDRSINIITSEGCLRNCTYCSEPTTSDKSWLTYDVDDCAAAVETVIQLTSANGIKLHDPNFLHNTARALDFARALASTHTPWAATIHPADLLNLDEGSLDHLAKAGLSRALVGLESPVKELVKLAGKVYDVDRIEEMAIKLASRRISGMFTYIVGWPGADPSHYQETIDSAFAIKNIWSGHQAKIHFLEPWPGTPIFNLISRTGKMPKRSLQEWSEIDYYFAHHPGLHDPSWERRIREANSELSPYVEA